MDRWIALCIDGWKDGWMYGWVDLCIDRWKDGWMVNNYAIIPFH